MLLECCSGAALVYQIKLNETLLQSFFTFKLVTCVNFEYLVKPFFQTSAGIESLRKELFSIVTSGPSLIWFSLRGVSNGKDFQVGCIRVLH